MAWRIAMSFSHVLVLMLVGGSISAQQNPFEIKKRSPQNEPTVGQVVPAVDTQSSRLLIDTVIKVIDSTMIPDTVAIQLDSMGSLNDTSENVFDLGQSLPDSMVPAETAKGQDESLIPPIVEKPLKKADQKGLIGRLDQIGQANHLDVDNRNLLFGVSILILLLLASLLAVDRSLVRKSYRAIANDNYLRFLYREYKTMPWLYWLFYLHFFLNAGFFLYLNTQHFHWYDKSSILVLLVCVLFMALIYLIKHMSLSVLASMFPVDKEVHLYGFVTILINILLGLALLPINLLIAFGPHQIVYGVIWVGIVILVLAYFFRQLKGLFIAGRLVTSYLFHFFLYLCTAEIAPLLIIGKLALDNLGIH